MIQSTGVDLFHTQRLSRANNYCFGLRATMDYELFSFVTFGFTQVMSQYPPNRRY